MTMKYFKEHDIRDLGGSKIITLTEALNLLNIDVGDKVKVTVENNKIIIEKVEKK